MTGDTHATDVCVVGGGIIGLAVAFELARRGRRVTVFEAARIGEQAAAGVAAGMLAPASEADIADPRLTPLALASHADYTEWAAEVERASGLATGFDRTGTLWVAMHRDDLARLAHLEAFQRERGLRAERVSAADLRGLEPLLAPGVVGGLRLRDDWQVDPRLLMRALAAAVTALGGTVHEDRPVRRIEPAGAGYAVHYERAQGGADGEGDDGGDGGEGGPVEAEQVVAACGTTSAGAWPSFAGVAFEPLPLRPLKGQVLRLRGEPLVRHVVRTPDAYLVPRASGELVVGATMEEQGFDRRVTAGAAYDLLREARRVLPGILELELAECSAGFRPVLPDHLPAVGAAAEGLFVATGHFRNGVELAPATARLLADLMLDGRADPLLERLSPLRFQRHEAGREEVRA